MTPLGRVVRRTVLTLRGDPLVLALTPEGITFRVPRARTSVLLPYGTAYQWANELAVAGGRIAKPRARKR